MLIEEYKSIKNFENYAVSNTGKVKRISKGHGTYIDKELYQSINNAGYKTVILFKDKKAYCRTIHKLVAEAFLEKPDDYLIKKYDIDHIDNNKLNNNVINLQFLTHRENMKKAWDTIKRNKSKMGKI